MAAAKALGILVLLAGCTAAPSPPSSTDFDPGVADPAAGEVSITNSQGSTPTRLYVHPMPDPSAPMPLNTQLPSPLFRYGIGPPLGVPVECGPGTSSGTRVGRWLGFSSPGYVHYNETEADGTPRIHDEAQMGDHLRLDSGKPMRLTWHLATATQTAVGQGNVVLPDVAVHGVLRERTSGTDEAGWDEGPILAEGEASGTLAGPATTSRSGEVTWHQTSNSQGEEIWVYSFVLDLGADQEIALSRTEGFALEVVATMPMPACDAGEGAFTPRVLEAYSSATFRAFLEVAPFNAVSIEYLHPQWVGDELVIHVGARSVWGTYDLDEQAASGTNGTKGGFDITISGPSEARSLRRAQWVDPGLEEGRHSEPIQATYVWPWKADGAAPGRYDIGVKAQNDQHVAAASAERSITL